MKFRGNLIIGLTLILGWTPCLPLVLLCLLGVVTSVVGIFHNSLIETLSIFTFSIGGILGFIALTSLTWGLQLSFFKRLLFLCFGVLAMGTLWLLDSLEISSSLQFSFNWFTFYFLVSPIVVGIFHIGLHIYALGKLSMTETIS